MKNQKANTHNFHYIFYYSKSQAMTVQEWVKFIEKCAAGCARDIHPISIVDGDSFKEFFSELNAAYRAVFNGTLVINEVAVNFVNYQ